MVIRSFKDLNSWQESHQLVLLIYKISSTFPKSEQFGLTNQIRRASVSITSNIAEGFGRKGKQEKLQFLHTSLGSLFELQSQIEISKDLKYINQASYINISNQINKVTKIIHGSIRSLKLNY